MLMMHIHSVYTSVGSFVKNAYLFTGATMGFLSALIISQRVHAHEVKTTLQKPTELTKGSRISQHAASLEKLEEQCAALQDMLNYLMKKIDDILSPDIVKLRIQMEQISSRIGTVQKETDSMRSLIPEKTIEVILADLQGELDMLKQIVEKLTSEIFESDVDKSKHETSISEDQVEGVRP